MTSSSSSSFIHNLPNTFPKDALSIITSQDPIKRIVKRALQMQTQFIKKMGNQIFYDLGIHPKYPLAKLLPFRDALYMPKQMSNFFWYLASFYTIAIEVPTVPLHTTIQLYQDRPEFRPACETQMNTLTWFAEITRWKQLLDQEWKKIKGDRATFMTFSISLNVNNACPLKCYTVFMISLNCELIGNTPNFHPKVEFTSSETPLREDSPVYRRLQKLMFPENIIIPDEICPPPTENAPWEILPDGYMLRLTRKLDYYHTKIAPIIGDPSPFYNFNPNLNHNPSPNLHQF
ncbi:hypothetical protein TIFTF001_030187 [Ficus carica]|uniref:Uncharacterized protein n=1 Tax=Ficus carica TaxID=3494 RepID=A0AA88J3T6_FICCA|nr:hypothetical protein TIFTF001_030187 [Ficus carica]